MDWLLQSIKKQVPEKVKKYLLKKTSKKEASSKIRANKRGREDDGKTEDLVKVIVKKAKDDRMIQRTVHRADLVSLVDDGYSEKGEQFPADFILSLVNICSHQLSRMLFGWTTSALYGMPYWCGCGEMNNHKLCACRSYMTTRKVSLCLGSTTATILAPMV